MHVAKRYMCESSMASPVFTASKHQLLALDEFGYLTRQQLPVTRETAAVHLPPVQTNV